MKGIMLSSISRWSQLIRVLDEKHGVVVSVL